MSDEKVIAFKEVEADTATCPALIALVTLPPPELPPVLGNVILDIIFSSKEKLTVK